MLAATPVTAEPLTISPMQGSFFTDVPSDHVLRILAIDRVLHVCPDEEYTVTVPAVETTVRVLAHPAVKVS